MTVFESMSAYVKCVWVHQCNLKGITPYPIAFADDAVI